MTGAVNSPSACQEADTLREAFSLWDQTWVLDSSSSWPSDLGDVTSCLSLGFLTSELESGTVRGLLRVPWEDLGKVCTKLSCLGSGMLVINVCQVYYECYIIREVC